MDETEQQNQNKVLGEPFEVDGKMAQAIIVNPDDLSKDELEKFARNSADSNFKTLDEVPMAGIRASIRGVMHNVRGRIEQIDILKKTLIDSKKWEKAQQIVYPDESKEEHVSAYRDRTFPRLINNGQLGGAEVDGKIVAVQGCRALDKKMADGRSIYEFTKASTLLEYRKKGFNTLLKKKMYDEVDGDQHVWFTVSRNAKHIERFKRRGWHVTDLDDNSIEAVKLCYDPYFETLKKLGYMAIYADPKVDKLTWDAE